MAKSKSKTSSSNSDAVGTELKDDAECGSDTNSQGEPVPVVTKSVNHPIGGNRLESSRETSVEGGKDASSNSPQRLSKGQKERLRKMRVKERMRTLDGSKSISGSANNSSVLDATAAPGSEEKSTVDKKIQYILEQMDARKKREDELKRLEEEECKIREEEERKLEEEKKEEGRKIQMKKDMKKQKMEKLKREGAVCLTPAQKRAESLRKKKLSVMLNSGMVLNNNVPPRGAVATGVSKRITDKKHQKLPEKKDQEILLPDAALAPTTDQEEKPDTEGLGLDSSRPIDEPEQKDERGRRHSYSSDSNSFDKSAPVNWYDDLEGDDTEEDEMEKGGGAKESKVCKKEEEKIFKHLEGEKDHESQQTSSSEKRAQTPSKNHPHKKSATTQRTKSREGEESEKFTEGEMRSPICCILGHVDTGKTKLLDKIRQTNVQGSEAGGITQQIGATFFPLSAIIEKTGPVYKDSAPNYSIPGLLVIDTPGHESFSNLRQRGSSLCNMAILVVDMVHGLEKQTIESLNILRKSKTPFIVALNKLDRIYNWVSTTNGCSRDGLANQKRAPLGEFRDRLSSVQTQLLEQGINSSLYWENKNVAKYANIVPVSALTGEGVPDLLDLITRLTQERMRSELTYKEETQCTVLEVKVVEGLGTTIDVILTNGILEEGQRIGVCGTTGPIVTTIRSILTPQPMEEIRSKTPFVSRKSVRAAQGVRIVAQNLEKAVAGSRVVIVKQEDDEQILSEIMSDFSSLLGILDKKKRGVYAQASSLGSLEALITFLNSCDVPIIGIGIGPVHKKDVVRASATLETAPEYSLILAFDVPVEKEAQQIADEMHVKIFKANIIYHLFDEFSKHMEEVNEEKRKAAKSKLVYPCILQIVLGCIFNKANPIIVGVSCTEGVLKLNTPLCVMDDPNNPVPLGIVTGIEVNRVAKTEVVQGGASASIKIEPFPGAPSRIFGRHFNEKSTICAHMTSDAVELLGTLYKNSLRKVDQPLVEKLRKMFKI